jgi:PKD repeat protein
MRTIQNIAETCLSAKSFPRIQSPNKPKPMKRYLLVLLICISPCFANHIMAQLPLPPKHCGTMYADSLLRTRYPQMGTFDYTQTDSSASAPELSTQSNGLVTIPVIFHIIHYGEAVGTDRNISQAQVNSQITVMNEDFRRMMGTPGWNNHPSGADIEIEFCPAIVDPDGNYIAEPGIHRVDAHDFPNAGSPPWDVESVNSYIKPGTSWDPERFYNIWVVDISMYGGYAQFPDSSGLPGMPDDGGPANEDGVQIYYQYVGRYPDNPFVSDFNMGRIAAHETGHFLGLRHAWGDVGGCEGTDYCNDTPVCGEPGNYHANTECEEPYECNNYRMISNYMDYSLDHCLSTFTLDQKARMRHVLNTSPRRRTLGSSNACSAPPNCTGISFAPEVVSENTTVQFTAPWDGGYATTYQWYFEGGNISASTDANPVVHYTYYGVYDVTVTITNQFGTCTMTHADYISVFPDNPCDTLKYPAAGTQNIYSAPGGFVCGWNDREDQSKAEYFQSPAPYVAITGGLLHVAEISDNGNNAFILCRLWKNDGINGSPGTIAAEQKVLLSEIATGVPNGGYYELLFPDPVDVEGEFYFGFTMAGFGSGDSLGIYSNTDGETVPASAWVELSSANGGNWSSFSAADNLEVSMQLFPYVTMNPAHAEINQPVYGCVDSHIQFSADTNGTLAYHWSFPGGSPSVSTEAEPVVYYDEPGTYSIYLSVIGEGCHTLDRDSSVFVVHGNPSVAVSTQEPACYGYSDGEAIIGIMQHANDSIEVNPNDPIGTELSVFNHLLVPLATYVGQNVTIPWFNGVFGLPSGDYSAIAVNAYGCVSEVTFTIGQPDEISITTGATPYTCAANPNGTGTANVTGGTQPYSYQWNDQRQQTSSCATGLPGGTYQVVVIDSNGCTSAQSANVPFGVPFCVRTNVSRIMNPDGGGVGTLILQGMQDYPDATVRIFDALGQEVYASVGYDTPWDGTRNGLPLPGGVYTYSIVGRELVETGSVVLVR